MADIILHSRRTKKTPNFNRKINSQKPQPQLISKCPFITFVRFFLINTYKSI